MTTTLVVALFALAALRPPVPRHATPFNVQFALSWWINEAPVLGLAWLSAGTVGTLIHPQPSIWWWLVCGLAAVDVLLLARIAVRARSARPALSAALQAVYGPGGAPHETRPAWWRLLLPVVSWRPDVRRVRARYGPARRGNRLDVYVSRRDGRTHAPVLVYFHAGLGNRMWGARSLIYRLAAQGWVCVSAGRRQFRVGHRDQLADVRAALAWVRAHAEAHGGDPDNVFAAGGSLGAGLAATAALSGSEVRGVIGLYGWYGVTPQDCITPDAPPFLIVHGALDTLVPRQDARAFADRLRTVSRQPVVHAELPGANHNFDFFHSLRFHAVTDAVVRFTQLVEDAHQPARSST